VVEVRGVCEQVADELPRVTAAYDLRLRARLEVDELAVANDVGVGAAERLALRERWSDVERAGFAQLDAVINSHPPERG